MLLATFAASRSGSLPTLLLVEDHADTRIMYAEFLSASFDVLQAADAYEAFERITETIPALVITDVSLPGIDGFEFVRRLRARQATRQTPVICLSGYGGHPFEAQADAAGCRLLQKPCLPDVLAQAAEDLLRDRRDRSQP